MLDTVSLAEGVTDRSPSQLLEMLEGDSEADSERLVNESLEFIRRLTDNFILATRLNAAIH
jgi:hypothetical protein